MLSSRQHEQETAVLAEAWPLLLTVASNGSRRRYCGLVLLLPLQMLFIFLRYPSRVLRFHLHRSTF